MGQERNNYAAKLKVAGNKAYGIKDYKKAISLYGKAILCKPDPVYYSNRAACYNVLSEWEKVVEDTSAAISMDSEYVKALNRRAHAYEHLGKYSEALLDYTASCIIDGFKNDSSAQSVERLLKKVAEKKGRAILEAKTKKLPSATFVSNYLQSFRARPPPEGLEPTAELDENSGKGQLQKGLIAMKKRTGTGYEEASAAFKKALELGGLDQHEAFALNMRATFEYLESDVDAALKDLTDAIEKQPSLSQAYIKRASMKLELGSKEAAANDFELAMEQNKDDPDIYYHRAQLHFILGEWVDAAKDYQKSIDLDPDFIYSHIQLGVTQYKMGSITSSMATFRRTVKKFDRVPDVYNYYGELLLDQQKYTEAIERFETAIDMERQQNPTNMNVLPLINKALALFQWKQDFKQAEELCEKALVRKLMRTNNICRFTLLTRFQLILNAILLSRRWHSCSCSKARSRKHWNTLRGRPNSVGRKVRLSTPCHMPKPLGRSSRYQRSTHSCKHVCSRWEQQDWGEGLPCDKDNSVYLWSLRPTVLGVEISIRQHYDVSFSSFHMVDVPRIVPAAWWHGNGIEYMSKIALANAEAQWAVGAWPSPKISSVRYLLLSMILLLHVEKACSLPSHVMTQVSQTVIACSFFW